MLDVSECVVVPACLTRVSGYSWDKNFTDYLVHLGLQQDAVLVELWRAKNSVEHSGDSGEPFVWTFNFVLVDVPILLD